MKKTLVLFLVIVVSLAGVAQKVELTGDIRTGSGYAALFGAKTSESWSMFYSVNLSHKSGFGVAGYRLDDFRESGLGRIGFLDVYWSGKLSKIQSIYSAVEYGVFDNDKKMSFICPYIIWSIDTKFVSVNLSPMYCYYDKLDDDQIVFRAQVVKEIYSGGTIKLSGWYNDALTHKYYGGIGFTQKLPKNLYLQGELLLFREGKTQPMLNLGYKF